MQYIVLQVLFITCDLQWQVYDCFLFLQTAAQRNCLHMSSPPQFRSKFIPKPCCGRPKFYLRRRCSFPPQRHSICLSPEHTSRRNLNSKTMSLQVSRLGLDQGKAGEAVTVYTNFFELSNLPGVLIHHYHGKMSIQRNILGFTNFRFT